MTHVLVTGGSWADTSHKIREHLREQPDLSVSRPGEHSSPEQRLPLDVDAVVITNLRVNSDTRLDEWVREELIQGEVPFVLLETERDLREGLTPTDIGDAALIRLDFWKVIDAMHEAKDSDPKVLSDLLLTLRSIKI